MMKILSADECRKYLPSDGFHTAIDDMQSCHKAATAQGWSRQASIPLPPQGTSRPARPCRRGEGMTRIDYRPYLILIISGVLDDCPDFSFADAKVAALRKEKG